MDQSMLKNSDALIMTGITQAPTANPDAMLGEFCTHLGKYNKKTTWECTVKVFQSQISYAI